MRAFHTPDKGGARPTDLYLRNVSAEGVGLAKLSRAGHVVLDGVVQVYRDLDMIKDGLVEVCGDGRADVVLRGVHLRDGEGDRFVSGVGYHQRVVVRDVRVDDEYGADTMESAGAAHWALTELHAVLGFRLKTKKAFPPTRGPAKGEGSGEGRGHPGLVCGFAAARAGARPGYPHGNPPPRGEA